MPGSSDKELLGAMQEFHRALYRFIRERTRDDELAKDLLQDTYLKALMKQDSLTEREKLAGWLFRIAGNTVTDHFRKQRPRASLGELSGDDHGDRSLNERYLQCLPHMLAELDEKYSRAIELGLEEELPQHVIAQRLGISYTGARSRIQRARAQLEALFRERCGVKTDVYGNVIDDTCGDSCGCPAEGPR